MPKAKLRIKLAGGKERTFQHNSGTTFWSPDGKPMLAQQFIEQLFGTLPELFKDEAELRENWSEPETRRKLVAEPAESSFAGERLEAIRLAIDSEDSGPC